MKVGIGTILALSAVVLAGCRAEMGEENLPPAEGDLSSALVKAKESGRNVLVFYDSESCPYSRQMRQQTLSDSKVKEALGDLVYVHVEQGVNAGEFEKRWGKPPTPTVVTLDSQGQPVGDMVSGVVGAADFVSYVDWAKTGEGPQPSIAMGGG